MIDKIKKNKNYIIAFLIPLVILVIGFFSLGLLYNDGKTIFVSDMDGQYKALFVYLKDHFFDTYSFGKGLGGSMTGTIAYYLMSPLNIIALLFSNANMYIGILIILTLKLSLGGLTMYIFLKHHYPKGKSLLLFSTCYPLIAYSVVYVFHIMWFDCIYLLPLILLGIDYIVKKKKPCLYIITLCMAIFTNYYIAYMLCIFSVIYFLYRMCLQFTYKNNKKEICDAVKKFLISSLLAGLMAAVLLLPTVLEFKEMPKSDIDIYEMMPLKMNTTPTDFLSRFFIGTHNNENILSYNSFHVYAGILVFILVLLYFLNKNITKKEKYVSGGVLGIFLLSIFVNYIDYMWNGFNTTACFSGRYTFIFSFFMIMLAVRCFQNIEGNKKEHYYYIAPIYPIMGVIVFLGQLEFVKTPLMFVSIGLFFLYLLLLYAYSIQEKNKKMLSILLFFLVSAELLMNMFFCLEDYKFRMIKETKEDYQITGAKINEIKNKDKTGFYRLEKNYAYSSIDSIYFDYKGVSTFLSTISKKQLNFLGKVGYNVHNNMIEYGDYSPVTDSLFGIKYVFQKSTTNPYYKKIGTFDVSTIGYEYHGMLTSRVTIYENENAMALGTLLPVNASKCKIKVKGNDRLAYQNELMSCLYGKPVSIYENIPFEKKNKHEYILTSTKQKRMFMYPDIRTDYLKITDVVHLSINDLPLGTYNNNSFAIQEFDNRSALGTNFTVKVINEQKPNKEYTPYAYYFNDDTHNQIFKELNKAPLTIISYKNNKIKGEMKATKDNHYVFTTIPYDKNWKVYVDGKEISYDTVWDTFIGFDVKPGMHTVEFVYNDPSLMIGAGISIASFVAFLLYIHHLKKKE